MDLTQALPAIQALPACPDPERTAEKAEEELTLEKLLERMDAVRGEMLSLPDAVSAAETAFDRQDEAAAGIETVGKMFLARETTCRQQLAFLEKIYDDHFSLSREKEKTERIRMVLDQLNSALSGCHGGNGSPEEITELIRFYGGVAARI